MTGGKVLLASLIFRRVFHRLLGHAEQNIGVLMPTSVYGVLANIGLAMDRRTSVNLNYTFGIDTINYCIRQADLKHIVTSRRVLEQEKFRNAQFDAELIFMEEAAKKINWLDKLTGVIDAYVTPIPALEWALGLTKIKPDDIVTIFFTSGSTGTPKGAMITQRGIAENVAAFGERLNLTGDDVVLEGSLPLFHSFGYTTTLWLPAMTGVRCIYHFNPLEPKKIGEVVQKYGCTAMPTTPTFLRGYLRRPAEEFASLKIVICGAEKLPIDLIDAWEAKHGVRPAEGYGTTELSPVVAVNCPASRRADYRDLLREGTIGKPLRNLEVRVTDLDGVGAERDVLPPDTPGMLEVKGPSVMAGYYKDPEKTAEVLQDGWYKTGDIASIDKDGFIWITGRQSRISKIGGEMVPHILIEEEIEKFLSSASRQDEENPTVRIAVSAVPESKKGEKIVILYRELPVTPEEICRGLHEAGLPNLWIPSAHDFYPVDDIPLLGTGKLDLRAVKEMAEKVCARS